MKLNVDATIDSRLELAQPVNLRSWCCWLSASLLVMAILVCSRAQAAEIDLETQAELQLSLKHYIDAGTVGGVYEHFNVEQGEIEKLRLKTLHPVIFVVESKYMMCADFLDANGKEVILDYIVGSSANGFRIEQEIPGRRSYLQQFFKRIDQ